MLMTDDGWFTVTIAQLVEGIDYLLPVKFHEILMRFQMRSGKCLSQSEPVVAILDF